MAILTHLSNNEAKSLGRLYGLDVEACEGILAGSVNSNYALHLADNERVFLRIYEEQGEDGAVREARLLDTLATQGVKTPRPLQLANQSGFIANHLDKPIAIFPWIEGDSLCQARVTAFAMDQIGEAVAEVHIAGQRFEGAPNSRFGPKELQKRIERARADANAGPIADEIDRVARALEPFLERTTEPGGLVHGDLFRDNVLWKDGRIAALLDFESASHEAYSFDAMVTLLAWCFTSELDRDLCRAFLRGYTRVRPFDKEERARLYEDARFAALRFSITRITDYELRPRGKGIYKDFRRFLARYDAIDRLGERGFEEFLDL